MSGKGWAVVGAIVVLAVLWFLLVGQDMCKIGMECS